MAPRKSSTPIGQPINRPVFHRFVEAAEHQDQHGWKGLLDGRRVHRAPMAVDEYGCVHLHAFETGSEQREPCRPSLSKTSRTARSRTSGENLSVVLHMMLHPTQGLEPPANPAQFRNRKKCRASPSYRWAGTRGRGLRKLRSPGFQSEGSARRSFLPGCSYVSAFPALHVGRGVHRQSGRPPLFPGSRPLSSNPRCSRSRSGTGRNKIPRPVPWHPVLPHRRSTTQSTQKTSLQGQNASSSFSSSSH